MYQTAAVYAKPNGRHTYRVSIDLVLIEVRALKVVEIWKDIPVLFLVLPRLQLEDGRDELRETEKLGYDGIASAHKLQNRLATVILWREKVLRHGESCLEILQNLSLVVKLSVSDLMVEEMMERSFFLLWSWRRRGLGLGISPLCMQSAHHVTIS